MIAQHRQRLYPVYLDRLASADCRLAAFKQLALLFERVYLCQCLFGLSLVVFYVQTNVVGSFLQMFIVSLQQLQLCSQIPGRQVLLKISLIVLDGHQQPVFFFLQLLHFNFDRMNFIFFFLRVCRGLLDQQFRFLYLDLLLEFVHAAVFGLELLFRLEDLLLDLRVGFELSLVLF